MKTKPRFEKTLLIIFLLSLAGISRAQIQPVGTVIGNQTVINVPISQSGTSSQALIYYPDDYFLPQNANKRYPLLIFLHGAGEGAGNNIAIVNNTSLPQLISQGLKPSGIDSVTGEVVKFIVVSPHAANTNYSYSFGHVKWILPNLISNYRVDTTCVWVGGLSAGGRGTWSMAKEDLAVSNKLAGIVPISALGYEYGSWPQLDTAFRRGLACFNICGALDAHVSTARTYNDTIVKYIGANNPKRYWRYEVPGADHNSSAWNPPFQLNNRWFNPTKNLWDLMVNIRRSNNTTGNGTTSASAGNNQVITLPTNSTTLTGTFVSSVGINAFGWERVSGPNNPTIATPTLASTAVTGLIQGAYVFRFNVLNILGITVSSQVTVTVNAATPVVDAGSNQTVTLPATQTSLAGTVTTPPGTSITTYAWSRVSGPTNPTLSTPNAPSTSVTGLNAGSYVFRLTATNSAGVSSFDDVTVTVNTVTTGGGGSNLHVIDVAPTEYRCVWLYSDNRIRRHKFVQNAGGIIVDTMNVGNDKPVRAIGAGFNTTIIVAADGTLYMNRPGNATVQVTTDTLGNSINNAINCWGSFYDYVFTRSDSTLWYFGTDGLNLFPNSNSIVKPIQISPAGMKVNKVAMSRNKIIILTTTGQVWEIASGNITPVQKALPRPAIDVMTGYLDYSFALVPNATGSQTMGYPYVWGNAFRYWGGSSASSTPVSLTSLWNVTVPIKQIVTSSNVIHWIDSLGVRRAMGDNGNGEVGTGEEKYNKSEIWGAPYSGAWHEADPAFMITTPFQLAAPGPGRVWKKLWGGQTFQFYMWATDDLDSTYFNGREKSVVGAKGVQLGNESTYPNGLDQVAPEKRSILERQPVVTGVTFVKYTLTAGADKYISTANTTLSATGTPSTFDTIKAWHWYQLSGPNTSAIASPSASQTNVTGLANGTYVYRVQMVDNRNGSISDTITVTVSSTNFPPTANAGNNQTITLPVNSANLSGTGTDPDGTITTFQWRKIAGPTTFNIAYPNMAQTSVGNLVQGLYQFELTVTDNLGATDTDTMSVTVNPVVPPANQLPSANAGNDQTITLPVNSAILNGTGSDPDGAIASFQWTKIAGPASFVIVSANQALTAVNSLDQGIYKFELKATDAGGAVAKDTVTITVNPAVTPANQSPSVNAGASQSITLPLNTVTLSGSATDPDGTIASYQWTKLSGPATFTIVAAGQALTVVNTLIQGVYQFELRATDNLGATGRDTVVVTVNAVVPPGNQLPTVNAGTNQTITLPVNTVTLSGSAADADGTIAGYLWTKISGPASFNIATPAQSQTVINNLIQGTYQFVLSVTDNAGAIARDTVNVTVNPAVVPVNQVPTVNAGTNQTITLPVNTVTLSGSAADADGTIASYQWTKISGPASFSITSANQAQTTVTNLVQGVYQFELTVTDNAGAIVRDAVTITVNPAATPSNQPPTVNAGSNQSITLPLNTVTLSGTATDGDGSIISYQWAKISGPASFTIVSPSQAQTVINNLVVGVYQFACTATDNQGATDRDTVMITVNAAATTPPPANQAPTANAGGNISITLPLNSLTLTGNGTDADGTIASYQWTKVSGPATYTIASPGSAQTLVSNLVEGIYQFELRVTDNQGAVGRATITVTVNAATTTPVNQPPVANAGANRTITLPTNTLIINGIGVDADGVIARYNWIKVSGPDTFRISAPNQAQIEISNLVAGTYVFELTVTDNSGATGKDVVSVIVLPEPRTRSQVTVFPNPVTGNSELTVKIESTTQNSRSYIRIYDNRGYVVYQEEFTRTQSVTYRKINMSNLTAGVYFVRVSISLYDTRVIKVIKQ